MPCLGEHDAIRAGARIAPASARKDGGHQHDHARIPVPALSRKIPGYVTSGDGPRQSLQRVRVSPIVVQAARKPAHAEREDIAFDRMTSTTGRGCLQRYATNAWQLNPALHAEREAQHVTELCQRRRRVRESAPGPPVLQHARELAVSVRLREPRDR